MLIIILPQRKKNLQRLVISEVTTLYWRYSKYTQLVHIHTDVTR